MLIVVATIADSDIFQFLYPLVTIPLAAWYGERYTARRVARRREQACAPASQPANPANSGSGEVTVVVEQHEHYHIHRPAERFAPRGPQKGGHSTSSSDEDFWGTALLLLVVGLLGIFLIARGYAAARGVLVSILLLGGVVALGLTIGTYLGLRGLPTFRRAGRLGLIAGMSAQAVCVVNAYLLLHPSWTGGNYEQVFQRFAARGTSFAQAFAGQEDRTTFFLAYQGIGALLAILALVVALLSAFAISGQVEEAAGADIGFARRGAAWALRGPGGGIPAAWWALAFATLSAATCSGVVYNAVGQARLNLSPGPPAVTELVVTYRRKAVTARFSLDEPATVTMRVRRLGARHVGSTLNGASRRLDAGRQRFVISARRDRRALEAGRYRVELSAKDENGDTSAREGATIRVK